MPANGRRDLIRRLKVKTIFALCRGGGEETGHINQLCGQNAELLGAFEKLRKSIVGFVISVRQHRTTRLPVGELSADLTFEEFSIVCRENSSLTEIRQEKNNGCLT